ERGHELRALRAGPSVLALIDENGALAGGNRNGGLLRSLQEARRPTRMGRADQDQRLPARLGNGADEALETSRSIERRYVGEGGVAGGHRQEAARAECVQVEA